jgi:hypothetical protein
MPAARRTVATPAAQMREALERHRQLGLGFELAWKRGLERMKWPEDKLSRDEWKRALANDKHVWEAAYTGIGDMPRGLAQLTNFFFQEESEHFPVELVA